jgi:hypothetical protein
VGVLLVPRSGVHHFDGSVVVAVVAVRVMQVAINEVVNVVAVWHSLVPAAGSVHMVCIVFGLVAWSTHVRILLAHLDDMLIDVVAVRVMQMAIVQVVHMAIVSNGGMPAARTVLMVMVISGMDVMVVDHVVLILLRFVNSSNVARVPGCSALCIGRC